MTRVDGPASQSDTTPAARDLEAAGQLQRTLLPPSPLVVRGWTAVHRFEPAGIVSGDYVDLIPHRDRVYFMLGDVSGKGVAASMLMSQIHAMVRTLVPFRLPLDEVMARASALLCASSLPAQYATLVGGYVEQDGEVVVCNAGHPPPLAITGEHHTEVVATGVPIGLFCESRFASTRLRLEPGDTLLMYSDGLTEACNCMGEEYGASRLTEAVRRAARGPVEDLVDATLIDQAAFRASCSNADDVTVLALRRT